MSIKVGINGFGRIGRMFFKMALKNPDIEVVAINDLSDSHTMAHLLKYDSVHGIFNMDIEAHGDSLKVGGKSIAFQSFRSPEQIDWREHGVDIVAECSGLFRDRQLISDHLVAGARKVIISAPVSKPDITIAMGVNSNQYNSDQHHLISCGSDITNSLSPIASVLNQNFGIQKGMMTSLHSLTGDQRIVDLPHRDLRRARSASLSMIPGTTGAAKNVSAVIPELNGKLDGMSIRVPTLNASLIDFVATVEKTDLSVEDVNGALKQASEESLVGILGYSELPLVSIDFKGSTYSAIIDAFITNVNDNMIKVVAWFDNEVAFSSRMVDIAVLVGERL